MFKKIIAGLTMNDITAGQHDCYPDLQPVIVEGSKTDIMQQVKTAFNKGGDLWEISEFRPEDGQLKGTVTTATFGFTDKFDVWLEETDENQKWAVAARSRSQVGKGDFGKNARNLKNFYDRLKDRLNVTQ